MIVLGLVSAAPAQPGSSKPAAAPTGQPSHQPDATPQPPLDWKTLEAPVLTRHIELTSREQFTKAGEAYFSPDAKWVIFQAVPVPPAGQQPDPFYSMYVARIVRDAGHITGIEKPILVSAPGSANTCGWFHPTEPWRVVFGSTIVPPSTDQKSGFQVGTRKYVWMFPAETEVAQAVVGPIAAAYGKTVESTPAAPVFSRPNYDAECSYSKDGRFILYAHVRDQKEPEARADADIWVYDTKTGKQHALVVADGYDGGPFFSPDGKRICYRSDRKLNDMLQLFVADLKFDAEGVPVGIEREYQITDNQSVNWAPYWHPSGKFLVYGTSEVSHGNYEVFAIEIDDAKLKADAPGSRACDTLKRTRITQATGADVLPVFTPDGGTMMWTAQRGPTAAGEPKPSSQLWVAEFNAAGMNLGK